MLKNYWRETLLRSLCLKVPLSSSVHFCKRTKARSEAALWPPDSSNTWGIVTWSRSSCIQDVFSHSTVSPPTMGLFISWRRNETQIRHFSITGLIWAELFVTGHREGSYVKTNTWEQMVQIWMASSPFFFLSFFPFFFYGCKNVMRK